MQPTRARQSSRASLALTGYGAVFLAATVLAAWRNFTPVPIWDMWGAIDFYAAVQEGAGWEAWWRLFNEHRIVLAKALFWTDYTWFGGLHIFLIATNYALALAAIAIFWAYLQTRTAFMSRAQAVSALVLLSVWLLSWVQSENFTWAFQSQFFLAQLLPLAGFYCLYRAVQEQQRASTGWFAAACTLGVLSVGTMVSGIMALPMMVLYAAVLRMGWRRLGLLVFLAAVCIGSYMVDFNPPSNHGSVLTTLKTTPLGMVEYTLQYLGSPFQHLLQAKKQMWLGQCLGLVFALLSLCKLIPALKAPRLHALDLSLLTFIAYVAGIAFATAGGRLLFGMESALASRYTTPTMMAWTALGVLYAPQLLAMRGLWRAIAGGLLVLALAVLLNLQVREAKRNEAAALRMTAALALQMGVRDTARIGMLIWDPDLATRLVHKARRHGVSVFAHPPLAEAADALDTQVQAPAARCAAFVDSVRRLPDDPRFVAIDGALAPDEGTRPETVRLVSPSGTVVGYGLTHRWRRFASPGAGLAPGHYLTFTAYVRATPGPRSTDVTLTAPGTACSAALSVPSGE